MTNAPSEIKAFLAAAPNATVGDIGEFINGFAFKPSDRDEIGLPIIRIQNLTDRSKPLHRTKRQVPAKYLVNEGDLLVSWSATLDAFVWHGEPALVNQHIFKVVLDKRLINERFAYYLMKNAISDMARTEHLHGSTMKHINREPFLAHRVWLPSIPIQTKIASALDRLFDAAVEGELLVRRAKDNLDRYRESVLKSAVTGSLTAEWRKANPAKEDGKALLDRILRERRVRWEREQLASFAAKGKQPPKGWREKYEEPPAPDTTDLPQLPEGWAWATVAHIGEVRLGRQRSPKNCRGIQPTRYVRAANLKWGRLDLADVLEMDFTDDERKTYALHDGDVLLSEASGSACEVGKPALWRGVPGLYCFQNTVIRFRSTVIPPEFAVRMFESFARGGVFARVSKGVGIHHLGADRFSALPVPIPPLAEQAEVVNRIDTQLAEAEIVGRSVEVSFNAASQLRQSILKAAFEGRLVPQDPNDEPASVLLERIKASTPSQQPKKTTRQKVKVK